jgi:hypothetical protein
MLKEIRLAGGVRMPSGSFCGAFAESKLGKAAAERFGLRLGDTKGVLLRTSSAGRSAKKQVADWEGLHGREEWESQWPLN